jgi:hypothetical protein
MKHPIRFLCAAAVLVFVWAVEPPERETAKQTAAANFSGVESQIDKPNKLAPAADPARAFSLETGSERDSRIRDLLSAWATQDAEAALRWVSALENAAARCSTRSTVCFALAEINPRRAVVLALDHGADEEDDADCWSV